MLLQEDKQYLENVKAKALTGGRFVVVMLIINFLASMPYFYIPTVTAINKVLPEHFCKASTGEFEACTVAEYCLRSPEDRKTESEISNWAYYFRLSCKGEEPFDYIVMCNYIGSLLYTVFFGMLQDKIGRAKALKILSVVIFSILASFLFVTDIYHFAALVLLMQTLNGLRVVIMIYSKEVLSEKYFNVCMGIINTGYGVVGFFQMGIMNFSGDWKVAHMLFACFVGIAALGINYLYLESPSFLITKGKINEAKESLRHLSKLSGEKESIEGDLQDFELKVSQLTSDKQESLTFSEIVTVLTTNYTVLKAFLFNCLIMLEGRLFVNGILIEIGLFTEEVYFWNTVILINDFFGCGLSGFVANWLGSRRTMNWGMLLTGILSFATVFLKDTPLIGVNLSLLVLIPCLSLTPVIGFSIESIDKRYSSTLFNYTMALSQLYNSLIPWTLGSVYSYLVHGSLFFVIYWNIRN